MNRIVLIIFLAFILQIRFVVAQGTSYFPPKVRSENSGKLMNNVAIVQLELNSVDISENGFISFTPINYIGQRKWKRQSYQIGRNYFKCRIQIDEPVYFDINGLLKNESNRTKRWNIWWLVEPGDDITMYYYEGRLLFRGIGSEKFRLQYKLDSIYTSIPQYLIKRDSINFKNFRIESVEDFMKWSRFMNKQLAIGLSLIQSFKDRISEYAYNYIRAEYMDLSTENHFEKFYALRKYIKDKGADNEILNRIYDSIYHSVSEKWLEYTAPYIKGNEAVIENKILRQYSFDYNHFEFSSRLKLKTLFYETALQTYNGLVREQFITDYLPYWFMLKYGFIPETEKYLAKYYGEPGYADFKKWVKEQEIKLRERLISIEGPNFLFEDTHGNQIRKNELDGKYVFLNFMKNENHAVNLSQIKYRFRRDSNIVFVNIPVEKAINQEMIRNYAVSGVPTVLVMHPKGYILNSWPKIEWSKDNGKSITELVLKDVAYEKDGPYVFKNNSVATSISIYKQKVSRTSNPKVLTVQTDLDRTFSVTLKEKLTIEPSVFAMPKKLIAFSDIEGNFDSFRRLLQNNNIIDQNFNWKFGNGHLVFAGDMFDRGNQVTECLWLMYSLEEKARIDGGYVHFVLGNHEIMNLRGSHKYVKEKYQINAKLIGKTLTELYNEDSELGQWLRTKNVMERIGDLLFVHGGISHEVWRMPLTIQEMNDLVRPYYAKEIDSTNRNLLILYGSTRTGPENSYTSPFWFRGYYGDIDNPKEIPTRMQMDSTLCKFKVRRIVTGHTIVGDTISVHYNGKVINTDTKHSERKSEALFIDGINYYRVNDRGDKRLLFMDDKRVPNY